MNVDQLKQRIHQKSDDDDVFFLNNDLEIATEKKQQLEKVIQGMNDEIESTEKLILIIKPFGRDV